MKANEIMAELKALGSPSIKKVLMNHGIREPFFGVKVGDMKPIQKRIKKDYKLALDLYDTGNYDAMYLAGLIADDAKMTKRDLQSWVDKAYCSALTGSTVAWVASESPHGHEIALEWMESNKELEAAAGWNTLSSLVSIKPDSELDLPALKKLLQRVQKTIHDQPNRVRQAMNNFVIAVGCYVKELNPLAVETGLKIGEVSVDVGDTACHIPFSPDYIKKVEKRGSIGKKRKTAKC